MSFLFNVFDFVSNTFSRQPVLLKNSSQTPCLEDFSSQTEQQNHVDSIAQQSLQQQIEHLSSNKRQIKEVSGNYSEDEPIQEKAAKVQTIIKSETENSSQKSLDELKNNILSTLPEHYLKIMASFTTFYLLINRCEFLKDNDFFKKEVTEATKPKELITILENMKEKFSVYSTHTTGNSICNALIWINENIKSLQEFS